MEGTEGRPPLVLDYLVSQSVTKNLATVSNRTFNVHHLILACLCGMFLGPIQMANTNLQRIILLADAEMSSYMMPHVEHRDVFGVSVWGNSSQKVVRGAGDSTAGRIDCLAC